MADLYLPFSGKEKGDKSFLKYLQSGTGHKLHFTTDVDFGKARTFKSRARKMIKKSSGKLHQKPTPFRVVFFVNPQ